MSFNEYDKRMKQYEKVYQNKLIPHIPIIIRLDGRCFHNFTKHCVRPFDAGLSFAFQEATIDLYKEINTFKLGYGQSDEVSILLYNPETYSQEFFDGKLFKLCSVVASIFTYNFNRHCYCSSLNNPAYFDCRVFQLPEHEVANYFIWRQKDATRNSVQMLARSEFSHKQCNNKSNSNLQDMLMAREINWNDYPVVNKRGWCICKATLGQVVNSNIENLRPVSRATIDLEIPIFTQDRKYIEQHLIKEENYEK